MKIHPWTSRKKQQLLKQKNYCINIAQITNNVARLKQGVKKEEHLRLMYFIFKSGIWKEAMNETIYNRIDSLLNRVLNKDNPEYDQITLFGTGGVEQIYELYSNIY